MMNKSFVCVQIKLPFNSNGVALISIISEYVKMPVRKQERIQLIDFMRMILCS